MDASVEQLLGEAEVAGSVLTTVVQSSTLCFANPPSLVPVSCPTVSSGRVHGSPKSEKAVSSAIASGIPVKTKLQSDSDWTVTRGRFGSSGAGTENSLASQPSRSPAQHQSLAVLARGGSVRSWTLNYAGSLSVYRWNVLTQQLHHQNCTRAFYAHMLMITA